MVDGGILDDGALGEGHGILKIYKRVHRQTPISSAYDMVLSLARHYGRQLSFFCFKLVIHLR